MEMFDHPFEPRLDWKGYLAFEETSLLRYEFTNGVIHAMAGGTRAHNKIVLNISTELQNNLRGRPCETFSETMRLRIITATTELGYFPDVMVECNAPPDAPELYLTAPQVIIEVLSKNTARTDRSEKVPNFKLLDSVEDIILVDSRVRLIERYRRNNNWEPERLSDLEIPSLDMVIDADTVYRATHVELSTVD